MWNELLYAIPLGVILSFAAGPIFFVVIETSINRGRSSALSLDIGAVAADAIFIALAYFGSNAFIEYLHNNHWLALISGLAFFAFGGYYILKSKKTGQFANSVAIKRKRFLFVKGFLLNFLNVGVLFFWITTTLAIGPMLDHDPDKMLFFYLATIGAYLTIDLFKIYYANKFKEKLSGRTMQIIEKLMGFGLIGFGVFVVVRQFVA